MTWPQIDLYARTIARRRRERAAEQLGLIRAAQWADDSAVTQMRAELLGDKSQVAADSNAQLAMMGIRVRTKAEDV